MKQYRGDISIGLSYKDQYKFHEHSFDPTSIAYAHLDMLQALQEWAMHINDVRADLEYCQDLDIELHKELWQLLIIHGTPKQIQVATLIYKGMTQQEIADELKVGQPDISKCLSGNIDYSKRPPKTFGGIYNKLSKEIKRSNSIRKIMREIYKTDDKCYTAHYSAFKSIFNNYNEYVLWLKGEHI